MIDLHMVFTDSTSRLTDSNIANGSVIFNEENKNIYLKFNDKIEVYSKFDESDILDRLSNIEKAIKNININLNSDIIGIALTGEFDENGAKLAWIDENFNQITDNLDTDYFNSNPAFKFETITDSGNIMVKVPLAYWWKGIIPSGQYQGKWGMLVSTNAKIINGKVMKPNYVAFMNTDGQLQNSFAIGAYRGRLKDNKWMSISEGNPTGNYTLEETKNYCKANGGTYSLLTFQAWHDICSRAVIERKSFMLTGTDAARKTLNDITGYRGIVDAFYSYGDNSSVPYSEWMDGVQTKHLTASIVIQTFSNDGSRTYVDGYTTAEGKSYISPYPTEFLSNEYMDNLLFGKPETNSARAPAAGINDIIPDGQYDYGSSGSPYLGLMSLISDNPLSGPFYCGLDNGPTDKYTAVGGRLAAFL